MKIIKTTNWRASNGNSGITYTVTSKGWVYNINDTDFEEGDLIIQGDNLEFADGVKVVSRQESYMKNGLAQTGMRLKPKPEFELM